MFPLDVFLEAQSRDVSVVEVIVSLGQDECAQMEIARKIDISEVRHSRLNRMHGLLL